MLQNFQEIAEALLAAHPRRAGAWAPTPTAPCPRPCLAAESWGSEQMRVPVCTPRVHKGVCSPGSPFLEPCVHISLSHLGVGIHTHSNVCAHTDTPRACAQTPAQHSLHMHMHTLLVYAYPCLNMYTHTHPSLCARGSPPHFVSPPPWHSTPDPEHSAGRRVWGSPTHPALPQHSPVLREIKAQRGRHRWLLSAQPIPSGHRQQWSESGGDAGV